MVFAARFAKTLQFWKRDDRSLSPDGDWSAFWECDYLFFLALVAALDVDGIERRFKKSLFKALDDAEPGNTGNPGLCAANPRAVIDQLYGMAMALNEWGEKAKTYPDFQKDFTDAVSGELAEWLPTLIQFDKGTPPEVNDYNPFIGECSGLAFSVHWNLSKKDYVAIPYQDPCIDPFDSLPSLRSMAAIYLSALSRLRDQAKVYLREAQSGADRRHQPHIALFLAFLHLFRYLQDQLNGLTQKHLDYYYERILHLERRRQLPDCAHLVFQLAQGVIRHTLEPGTAFRAGKDSKGADLFYLLERPLSLHQAQVAELRTLYTGMGQDQGGNIVPIFLYEETILDTGKDSPVPKKMTEVQPFYALGKPGQGALAEVGFAISSAELLTSSANRWFEIIIQIEGLIFTSNDKLIPLLDSIDVQISTAEGWLNLEKVKSAAKKGTTQPQDKHRHFQGLKNSLTLTISLGKSHPATIAPTKALHGEWTPESPWPLLKIVLNQESLGEDGYKSLSRALSAVRISSIQIETNASEATDFEVVEAATGIVLPGSKNIEITRYINQGLIIRALDVLRRKLEKNEKKNKEEYGVKLYMSNFRPTNGEKIESNIKLYEDNFETDNYQSRTLKNNRYLFSDLSEKATESKPKAFLTAPATFFGDLSLTFNSKQKIFRSEQPNILGPSSIPREDDSIDQIFHLTPFGGYQPIKNLHQITNGKKAPFPLLPAPEKNASNGNLYIGLQQARPLQAQSLLFQIVEGTEENYDLNTPDIEWAYLSGDGWKRLPASAILYDSTRADPASKRSLVQSGILELAIPGDAVLDSPLIRPGFLWIRASGIEASDESSVLALPKLEAVHAQAGRVQLVTNPAAAEHFAQPLPPKTISQMKQRQAPVRKTEQLYPGFGGRAHEQDKDFYRRISERLRHRGRAITAWDYERLVLEQFPEVRALKCVQHCKPDNHCANGHVLVAVLPHLRNPEVQNPLQPQPSAALLENIKGYLRERANIFVAHRDADKTEYLHVVRPHYQEVAVVACVRFRTGIADDETLKMRLDQDIAAFISPWAYDAQLPPRFGTPLYRTELLCYLETLPYVDYVDMLLIGRVNKDEDGSLKMIFYHGVDAIQVIWPEKGFGILSTFQRAAIERFVFISIMPKDAANWPELPQVDGTDVVEIRLTLAGKDPYTPHHFIHVITETS